MMMLIKEMDLYILMVYDQHIKDDKIKEIEGKNKKTKSSSFNFSQPRFNGGNNS